MSGLADWFLTPAERGNEATELDRRHGDGTAWTEGNEVTVLVDGASYFERLCAALTDLGPGASVWLTDWEGHADERLGGPGTEVGGVFRRLVRGGVTLRGLLWRSHPRQAHFAEQDNLRLAKAINDAGGLLLLDERVRRGGSHHQKLVVCRPGPGSEPSGASGRSGGSSDGVAFVGGIDLCHGRHDDPRHQGDAQAVELDGRYGRRPPWHDIQLEVRGPAVGDLSWSFRERWSDPTSLDHRNPLRRALRRFIHQPHRAPALPPEPDPPGRKDSHAVQVLRTYPAKRPAFPFAPDGERSVARAYLKAFRRARRFVLLEDQYLWSVDAAAALAKALVTHRELLVVIVVPRYPDRDGRLTGPASRYARQQAIERLKSAGGRRVAVYDLENREGTPIYVHAKACVIDDVWLEVGSDNLNRRSWTHDSELACAVVDNELDGRAPLDPGGLGDGARRLARDTRLALLREHLGRHDGDDADLMDPVDAFAALATGAAALDSWHQAGRRSVRPPGQLRTHVAEPVAPWARPIAALVYRTALDPDGRPRSARRDGTY